MTIPYTANEEKFISELRAAEGDSGKIDALLARRLKVLELTTPKVD